ncbi:MAG: tetratricopeptide repeat protein [Nitrososphaeraceae archaeon]
MENESQFTDELRIASDLFQEERYEEAFERYRVLAENGSVSSQVLLGWMYHAGKGVQQSLEEAEKWYRKAAATNSPEGQFYLATVHRTKQNYDEAIEWLGKSASQDYSPAIYLLGKLYYTGEGVIVNRAKAFEYFERAAQKGHLFAQRNIAYDMIKGHRGIFRIALGVLILAQVLWSAVKVGLKDPDSNVVRRH